MFTSCMSNRHLDHCAEKQSSLLIHSNLMENSRNTRSGIFLREKS
ncbi:hypothetical protein GZOEXZXM_CDS0031 [Salmonella phage SeKF_64]|uniref:Uncharacterized protein n=1 Tax=Salmonella phage vB_STmST313_KE31 TaxID=3161181 RepID=A0AAU8GII8_9CAUD